MGALFVAVAITVLASTAAVAQEDDLQAAATATVERPRVLVPLYVSLASLQALDIASTLHAMNEHGGTEANPVMRPFVASPPAAIALKVAVTGASIYGAERLWKKNRTAAILLMVGLNGVYVAAVVHNRSIR